MGLGAGAAVPLGLVLQVVPCGAPARSRSAGGVALALAGTARAALALAGAARAALPGAARAAPAIPAHGPATQHPGQQQLSSADDSSARFVHQQSSFYNINRGAHISSLVGDYIQSERYAIPLVEMS